MKKPLLFGAFLALLLVSCKDKNDEPDRDNDYPFVGKYYSYDEGVTDKTAVLEIYSDFTFYEKNEEIKTEWTGTWAYDRTANIIELHSLTETSNGKTEMLENDYCWAQPYDNYQKLRFKEYYDDSWDSYSGWIRQ